MESATTTTRSGELIAGKYRLLERLGIGGMGEVYRATHEAIGRMVAIKLLRPEHATTAETVERLSREARAANLVRHPNVVDVLDFGTDEKLGVYLVQELLEGEDLSTHLERRGGRLPLDEALAILLPVIGGVASAHAAGVIHRDLKPSNVYLNRTPDGAIVPKVLDFGISKIVGLSGRIDVSTISVTLGTPAYMSPEQIQGEPIEVQTDVWSLGVILHQLLTGVLPFRGDSPGKQYVQICTSPPASLAEGAPGTPPEIIAIVQRCLEKSGTARFANAGEMLAAFDALPFAAEARAHTVVIGASTSPATNGGASGDSSVSSIASIGANGRRPRRAIGIAATLIVGATCVVALALARTRSPRDAEPRAVFAMHAPQPVVVAAIPVPSADSGVQPIAPMGAAGVASDAGASGASVENHRDAGARPVTRRTAGGGNNGARRGPGLWGVVTHY